MLKIINFTPTNFDLSFNLLPTRSSFEAKANANKKIKIIAHPQSLTWTLIFATRSNTFVWRTLKTLCRPTISSSISLPIQLTKHQPAVLHLKRYHFPSYPISPPHWIHTLFDVSDTVYLCIWYHIHVKVYDTET